MAATGPKRRKRGVFHYLLVTFALPARLPGWVNGGLLAMLAAALGWLWTAQGSGAGHWAAAAGLMFAFFALDRLVLAEQRRRRISFASWGTQSLSLAVARSLAAVALSFLAPLLSWWPALAINAVVQLAGTLALYRGAIVEPGRLGLTELTVRASRLPPGSSPIRILHVTDLHIERLGTREEQLLEHIRSLKPDLIVLTGDYVNISDRDNPHTHADLRQLLGQFEAPYGVYGVLGSPAVDARPIVPPLFDGLPVRLLRGEAVEVDGPGGQRLTLLGVDCTHDIDYDAAALDAVIAGAPSSGPRVLLYHSPELMPQAADHGIDLYLCGHTHGGQVRLPVVGPVVTSSKLGRRYVMGHYRKGDTHLYVGRGVGFEGLGAPRVRFLCPPEITLVMLVPSTTA